MAALVAVAWVPAAVLSSAGISFPQAKICPANGADRELGDLLGETKERTYLIERVPDHPRIASFPASQIGETFVGPHAQDASCNSVVAPSPTPSPPPT